MTNNHERTLLFCWVALIAATLITVYWGANATTLLAQVSIVLIIAVIKAGIIIDGFMELRHASTQWRLLFYGWPVVMSIVLAVTLLFAKG